MSGGMKAHAERLMLMLNDLRLPATRALWRAFAERADSEGWPAARLPRVMGDGWIGNGDNVLLFGPPGGGKSRLPLHWTWH